MWPIRDVNPTTRVAVMTIGLIVMTSCCSSRGNPTRSSGSTVAWVAHVAGVGVVVGLIGRPGPERPQTALGR